MATDRRVAPIRERRHDTLRTDPSSEETVPSHPRTLTPDRSTRHDEARAPVPRDGDLRALVVEDNAGDRWFFSETLRSRGHVVVACESGEAAWSVFDEAPPAIVVLDLMLPGIDGIELCRRIRYDPRGQETVVVAVTGRDDPRVLAEVLEAGADDFIRKPIDPPLFDVRLAIAERRVREQRERGSTRRALEAKTREMETLFQNLRDVFFSVDVTHDRLIQVSRGSAEIFGHSPEELLSDPSLWKRYLLPASDDGDPWAAFLERLPDEPVVSEYPVLDRTGSTRWVRATVTVQPHGAEGAVRVDGTVVDITVEREAHLELAERNEELAALNRLSELTLAAHSLEEAYDPMLEEISKVTGLPIVAIETLDGERDRLVVTASYGLPPSADVPIEIPVDETLAGTAARTGRPVVETDLTGRSGDRPEVLAGLGLRSCAAFPLTSGTAVVGVLLLAGTAPIPSAERLRRLGTNLAATVATYVERLEAEDSLRESESRHRALARELQEANQELESFAYSVSHDLRAPLRTMQGFAHALLQNFGDRLEPEARDYARRIIASGQQSEVLIRDLLAYSRLSFEQLDLKPVSLKAVVDAAREQVEGDITTTAARVRVVEPLPVVRGSRTILVQVVANMLANAVKFVPADRRPEVTIRAEKRDGDRARLWIEDNGIGIPPGQEERIFRVFERLGEGGERPGTGIGLAIVRRGMQRAGGSCGVEPASGAGSAFWIELPEERGRSRRPRRSRSQ